MNVGDNYKHDCSYKIWLYAGNSGVYQRTRYCNNSENRWLSRNIIAAGQSAGKTLMENNKWLKNIPSDWGHYLAGFVDGEGSFNVSLRKRQDHTMKWQVVLTFNVSQRESYILSQLKKHLTCGRLQYREDGVCYYVCTNPTAIINRIIPFFGKYRFRSATKKKNFSLFSEIAEIVYKKEHLNREGLEKVIKLREELNKGRGRKRKYDIRDWEKYKQENPQRLYAKPRAFRKERG